MELSIGKTMAKPKSFREPTLKEAICEIRYRSSYLPPDWAKQMPGKLLSALSNDFPSFEIIDESPFKFRIGGNVITETVHRLKFSSESHNFTVTAKHDSFALTFNTNEKQSYDWISFREKLFSEWGKLNNILGAEVITRIGIRFINLLEFEDRINLSDLISAKSSYVPKIVLEKSGKFLNKTDIMLDDKNKLIFTCVCQGSEKSGHSELILDIDRIREGEDMAVDCVSKYIDDLHVNIEEVFFGTIAEKYEQMMKPEN